MDITAPATPVELESMKFFQNLQGPVPDSKLQKPEPIKKISKKVSAQTLSGLFLLRGA